MPSRCIRFSSPTFTATCSWVDVITSSPFFKGRPLMMALRPSVAQLMRARSSLRQEGPSRRARRSLTSHQTFSSWPALGARSSVRVHSQKLLSTGIGQVPRPPKFRYDQPGSSTNSSRMSFQKAASPAAAAS